MDCIDRAKKRKTDIDIIVKVKKEITHGKINIDANIGVGYFFNDDMNKKKFLPVYDSFKQGVGAQTIMINKEQIDWISPNTPSDPLRDCVMPGGYNPVRVTVKLEDNVFVGDLNLGYCKRVSDRLNSSDTHFLPLLNVEYRGFYRTVFISADAIISVTDEVEVEPVSEMKEERPLYQEMPQQEAASKVYRMEETSSINPSTLPSRQRKIGMNDFVLKRN